MNIEPVRSITKLAGMGVAWLEWCLADNLFCRRRQSPICALYTAARDRSISAAHVTWEQPA